MQVTLFCIFSGSVYVGSLRLLRRFFASRLGCYYSSFLLVLFAIVFLIIVHMATTSGTETKDSSLLGQTLVPNKLQVFFLMVRTVIIFFFYISKILLKRKELLRTPGVYTRNYKKRPNPKQQDIPIKIPNPIQQGTPKPANTPCF
jgi:hypothetical protein